MRSALGMLILAAGLSQAQTEGARDLFFAGAAPKDSLPKIQKPAAPAAKAPAQPAAASAVHLGLRYTLLLVKARGLGGEPVDPARNFKKGECVAINLESNRSGYLYVLAKESGGSWTPLFPTPELADQDNRIDPGQVVRTPKESCFEIDDPPGAETLFVVLSRSPRDIYELEQSIRSPKSGPITAAVSQVANAAGTRDLPFKEVLKAPPAAAPAKKAPVAKESLHAVYVVNGSAKASSTIVTQIEIAHR